MTALGDAWALSSPGHREKVVAVAGPEMMSLWLMQGQGTWAVETDGVVTKAGRMGCSNQPLGHVTTPAAQCQDMMGHPDSSPSITWSEGRVSWKNQKKCNETTCWMKTEQTQTSFVIKFARTANLGAGGRERKVWKFNITVVLTAALLLVVKTGRSWHVQ